MKKRIQIQKKVKEATEVVADKRKIQQDLSEHQPHKMKIKGKERSYGECLKD